MGAALRAAAPAQGRRTAVRLPHSATLQYHKHTAIFFGAFNMEFTGERVVPGKVEADLFSEHFSRYCFARPLAAGKAVLDLGCGSGYGSMELARSAQSVLGMDVAWEAIDYARQHFVAPNLSFCVSDCCQLALADASLDAVVCFEVIEHLTQQDRLMREIRRVLKPEGFLLLSTPNRVFYTEERKEINPFHTREFELQEFQDFLNGYFTRVKFYYQNHVDSIFIGNPLLMDRAVFCAERKSEEVQATANFFLAVCSGDATSLIEPENLVYTPSTANLLREQRLYIDDLEQRIVDKDSVIRKLQREYEERTLWAVDLELQLKERDATIRQLQKELEEKTAWALTEAREIEAKDSTILSLQKELEEKTAWAINQVQEIEARDQTIGSLQKEFEERTAWALRLDAELKTCQENFRKLNEQFNDIRFRKIYKLAAALRLLPKY
jgi:SAM-dependent methyltransferase